MFNKAISSIIATVLLIALTIVTGTLILRFGNEYLKQLSPPADCSQVNFEAGIYEEIDETFSLEISNTGNKEIQSFIMEIKDTNQNIELKEIPISVVPSESKRQNLNFTISENLKIYLIPQVKNTQDKIVPCSTEVSKSISLINIGN